MNGRVWVTRDEEQGGELSSALSSVGLEPLLEPVLMRRVVGDPRAILEGLGESDWLVIASAFAAGALAGVPTPARVAAVGEATARRCAELGLRVELVSPDATGSSLWDALWASVSDGDHVCYPRSSLAAVPDAPLGISLTAPVLYRTTPRDFDAGVARLASVVALTSPSAVAAVASVRDLPRCASLGPTTSGAIRAAGLPVWIESREHTFEGLAREIAAGLRSQAHP